MNIDQNTFEKKILNNLVDGNIARSNVYDIFKYVVDMHSKKIKLSDDQLYQLISAITKGKKRSLLSKHLYVRELLCNLSEVYAMTRDYVNLILNCLHENFAWLDTQITRHKYVPTKTQLSTLILLSYKGSLKLAMEIYDDVSTDTLHEIIKNGGYDEQNLLNCLNTFKLSIPPTAYQYITHTFCQELYTHIITEQKYSNEAFKYILTYYSIDNKPLKALHKYCDKCIKLNGNDALLVVTDVFKRSQLSPLPAEMMDYIISKLKHNITPSEFCKMYSDLLIPYQYRSQAKEQYYKKYIADLIISTNICESSEMELFFTKAVNNSDWTTVAHLISVIKNVPDKCTEFIIKADRIDLARSIFDKKIVPQQHLFKYIKGEHMLDVLIEYGLCVDSKVVLYMLKKNKSDFDILKYGFSYDLGLYDAYCSNDMFDEIEDDKLKTRIDKNFEMRVPDYEFRHKIYSGTLSSDISVLNTQDIDHFMYEQLFKDYTKYEHLITACEKKYKYKPTFRLIACTTESETRHIIVEKIKSVYKNLPEELLSYLSF